MAISTLVTDANTEALKMILNQVPCIQYPVKFCKNKETVWTLIDFDNEVKAKTPVYAAMLDAKVCFTAVWA